MNSLLVGIIVACGLYVWSRQKNSAIVRFPPGPKALPLVGNIFDLTARELWLRVASWSQQYGS